MSLTKASYSMITGAPVNVLDYGAVADYSNGSGTDNGPAFQAAINAAIASKSSLYIPAGNYALATNITINSPIIVYGEGKQNSIIWITNSSIDGITIDDPTQTLGYVCLRDFKIGHYTLGTGNAIVIGYDVAALEFTNIYVEGSNYGIYCANRTFLVTMNNITAARCNYGVWLSGALGGGGSTIRINNSYSLSCHVGFYVQFCGEVSFNDCATDFTPSNVESWWGVQCYACVSIYIQNHHAEGTTAGTGPTAANITAALRFDDCQSIIVNGLYYDLDGSSGPVGVYAIASQIETIDSYIYLQGVTHGSYINASNRRIWTNSTSTGQNYLVEFGGDWGLSNSYINAGGTAVKKLSYAEGNLQTFGSDDCLSFTRATGINTGKLYSPADNQVRFLCVPNSGYTILECKNGSGVSFAVGLTSQAFAPTNSSQDNTINLGAASFRWATVYAGTGAINTSDEREKQNIEPIPQSWLDAWGDVEYMRFKFNDAVRKKSDGARWHIGLIAQRIKEAFENRGIDPFSIGLLCYDSWESQQEIIGDDNVIVQEARDKGNRYGVRYEEALALECAYLRSRLN